MKIAVVRVRGVRGVHPAVRRALDALGLSKVNSCAILDDNPSALGTVEFAKDYVAYGAVSEKALAALISKRGRIGNARASETMKAEEINSFAAELYAGRKKLSDAKLRRVFSLRPPRKGYGGAVKKSVHEGGALGRRDDMDALLKRMV